MAVQPSHQDRISISQDSPLDQSRLLDQVTNSLKTMPIFTGIKQIKGLESAPILFLQVQDLLSVKNHLATLLLLSIKSVLVLSLLLLLLAQLDLRLLTMVILLQLVLFQVSPATHSLLETLQLQAQVLSQQE